MKYLISMIMLASACAFAVPCNNANNYYSGDVSCEIGMTKNHNLYDHLVYQVVGNKVHMHFNAEGKVNLLVEYNVADNNSSQVQHFDKVVSLPKDNNLNINLNSNQHFANAIIVKYQNNNNTLSPSFKYHKVSIEVN